MSDEVSAEEAQMLLDASPDLAESVVTGRDILDNATTAGRQRVEVCRAMDALSDVERLARTVVTLHRDLAVLRTQLAPLLAVHDALVAAAALPGAGVSPEAMVAAVRAQAWAEGVEAMRSVLDNALVTLACCAEVDAGLGADRDEEQTTKASAFDRALAMLRAMPAPRAALIPLPGAEVSRG